MSETFPPGFVQEGKGSYSLEITPFDASRNSTLNLIPKGFNLTDAQIEWLVNGKPVTSPPAYQFKPSEAGKGDTVQAKAIIQGREVLSNMITIKNTPPELSKVKLMPEVFKQGDTLYVEATGSDIDGDTVTIFYEWSKNGEPAGNDKRIGVPIRRDDKVDIKLTPFDGEAHGRPVILHREIRNLPPSIIEHKEAKFEGNLYTYQIKASDPDGDPLTYSLKSSPQGMTINPTTGLISWNISLDFKGKAPITVSVTDGHGGEVLQSFTLEIRPEQRQIIK